ncbi:MAG: hypothetical protein GX447_06670 [Elusimicrobia bacterium]|nr:hypothetical protein [Elusimicrobiota bacterium]
MTKTLSYFSIAAIFVLGANLFSETRKSIYYCPMHPSYVSDKPGSCPICKMDLVLKEDETKKTEESDSKEIVIKNDMAAIAGIKTEKALKKDFILSFTMPAVVLYDKELYSILEEYKYQRELYDSISQSEKNRIKEILKSIEVKSANYGLNEESISELIKTGYKGLALPDSIMFAAAYVDEQYAHLISKGNKPELFFESKNLNLLGEIVAVSNLVDENRKIKIIIRFENKNTDLKFNEYARAKFKKNMGKKILIPKDSYIEYGDEDMIYVKRVDSYEMRTIKTGLSNDKYTEVLNGLAEGEEIVSSPNFLIDSETRLKKAANTHSH